MFPKVARLGLAGAAVAVFGVACVSSGVDSYEEFASAVEQGAPCGELFDIREGFDDRGDLERIDADLESIGCESRDSERDDE